MDELHITKERRDDAAPADAALPLACAAEERVLLLLESAGFAASAAREIAAGGFCSETCCNTAHLGRAIADGVGAAVLADEVVTRSMGELFAMFDVQDTWSDLPVIVLVRENASASVLASLQAFERHPKIKTTFLQRPVPALSLISAVRSGLKARQRQYQIRDLLRRLNEDVRQRDEFLAMLGHELRNPLSSIGYVADIFDIEGDGLSAERAKWGAGVIGRQVRHLSRLLDQLLDVARVQSGKIELDRTNVDLGPLAEQAAAWFDASLKKRHLTVTVPSEPVVVSGDRDRLTQIIDNLLDNAFKYTREGGRIDLTVAADDVAMLCVADNGEGIERESLPHVFEPFFQENRSSMQTAGLGLGLAMADRLVRLHGGHIEAASEGPGRGARFVVRLPLADAGDFGQPAARAAKHGPLALLIIEDDIELSKVFATLLKGLGHYPHVVHDGLGGLEAVTQLKPDLVFVDIGLPDVGGAEVARRMREMLGAATPPLVALTGYPDADDVDLFDDYLVKPIGRERVERLFRELL